MKGEQSIYYIRLYSIEMCKKTFGILAIGEIEREIDRSIAGDIIRWILSMRKTQNCLHNTKNWLVNAITCV